MSQQASRYDITAHQGSELVQYFTLLYQDSEGNRIPMDLSGKVMKGQVRSTYDSATAYDFDVQIVDEALGQVVVYMGANVTASIPRGPLVYDIELQDSLNPAIRFKPLWGNLYMKGEVTRI